MSSYRRIVLLIAGTLGLFAASGQAAPADPIKDAGLSRSGDCLVLTGEAPVLEEMKALRATKILADKETRARAALEMQMAVKKKTIKDDDKEWHGREARLESITDPYYHNQSVLRMNRLVAEIKETESAIKDLDEQAAKSSSANKIKFVDDLGALNSKVETLAAQYQTLAADAKIKASLARLNVPGAHVTLGPSPDLATAMTDLKKWSDAVNTEAIPLREAEGQGIHSVDVLVNGEHVVMAVDTGASAISVPADVADKLKIAAGPHDAAVQVKLANGSLIDGTERTIASVRVGRFTIEDVRCIVLQANSSDAPSILGGSFLNHFIVNLDPAKNELHLTALKDRVQTSPTAALPKP